MFIINQIYARTIHDTIYFRIKLSNNIEKAYFEELRVHITVNRDI